MPTVRTTSLEQTEALGEQVGQAAQAGWVVGLDGDLGAGKTAFVRGFVRGLGCGSRAHSPTFALLHEYRSARIAVLPSVHTDCRGAYSAVPELMGLTLIEAQSCGTPVVCTDAGAMPEFVADRVSGRVARQNSPESLAACFDDIADPARWPSYAGAARSFCAPFAMDQVAALHLDAYANL